MQAHAIRYEDMPTSDITDPARGRALIVNFLNASGGWFLGTSDAEGNVTVRPMSLIADIGGELVFSTVRTKDVAVDLAAHPQCGWSCWVAGKGWFKATCTCVPVEDQAGVDAFMLQDNPGHYRRYLSDDASANVHYAMRDCDITYVGHEGTYSINVG